MINICFKKDIAAVLSAVFLMGCVTGAPRVTNSPPAFDEGLKALERKDFALASYHFAELAKDGNPASMNNLGVALLMVNRKDEAAYWFNTAARYGDIYARDTLGKMGRSVPPADLVGRHPSQLQREATEHFISAVAIGALIGVSLYYSGKAERQGSRIDMGGILTEPIRTSTASSKSRSRDDPVTTTPDRSGAKEREVDVVDIYTRERYRGTVDSKGDISIRPAYDPAADSYRGSLDRDGSGRVKTYSGDEMKVEKR